MSDKLDSLIYFINLRAPMFSLALLIAALILFILAAIGVASGNYSLVAAGLACWVASSIVMKAWP
jgi:hypothetical protein